MSAWGKTRRPNPPLAERQCDGNRPTLVYCLWVCMPLSDEIAGQYKGLRRRCVAPRSQASQAGLLRA